MAAVDRYLHLYDPESGEPHWPGDDAVAVTPSDTADMDEVCTALYIGGAGTVTVITRRGNTVDFPAAPVGTIVPIRASRVKATGTSATNIRAFR